MPIYGIVSEFNPFHKGHEYLIQKARELGAEAVVCVMSGNVTQRGEMAIINKYLRAEAAIISGADLVLELPFPFCAASAQYFARGGIAVLSSICDTVIFGSECGDIDMLRRAAECSLSDEFCEEYASLLKIGEQSASAYVSLIKEKTGIELSSNDLLGVEYIKAARYLGVPLDFVTVKRQGSAYLCEECVNDGFDSAMAIRKLIASELDVYQIEKRLPMASFNTLIRAKEAGEITDKQKYAEGARLFYRLADAKEISLCAECEGGVGERICKAAHESISELDFISRISTKRYTDSKLRRAMLFGMCSVRDSDLESLPAYTLLLGADERGRELLASVRRSERCIRIITKPADVQEISEERAKRQSALERRIDALYTFSLQNSADTGLNIRKKPYIT